MGTHSQFLLLERTTRLHQGNYCGAPISHLKRGCYRSPQYLIYFSVASRIAGTAVVLRTLTSQSD